ncbi:phage portal protein [Mesorhizobium sp. CAU 1741]|uniref:phage portal protein n=1 Tax=Mesorhizobium sp. CAU 1741 TaxID=3140366 RepID=UPI00325B6235
MSPVSRGGGWFSLVRESFSGAWQQNVEVRRDTVLSNPADFACRTLIASDIAKMRVRLVQRDENGIWGEVENRNFGVLTKPNRYQSRIQFFESWVLSKLQSGNTYVLKQRDNRGRVVALYVLEPSLVRPLVSDDGAVYYDLSADHLSGLDRQIVVPASEIIHDRYNCFFHPLVGLSPIFAGGLAAMQGLAIQNDSTLFFQNGAQPGGVLTAPGPIAEETAKRLKEYWDTNFSGKNSGKVAVLGDGLTYSAMRAKNVDSQLIEQLRWTSEVICGVYHVPSFMIGVGQPPSYNNIQSQLTIYYSQCLQVLIEAIEVLLDEGLGLNGEAGAGANLGTEFDLDDLLRMDTATQYDVAQKAKGIATLDEQRRKLNLAPVKGGDTIYLQQQDHSLAAIAARDEQLIEGGNSPASDPSPDSVANDNAMREQAAHALAEIYKGLR